MKQILHFLLIFLVPALVHAQSALVRGVITTADGAPAENITVAIDGSKYATVSNGKGNYEIKNYCCPR